MPSHKNFRFPPVKEGNETLALRPLLIPGMLEPVQDGDGGINIKVATDDPQGLLCVINPYLSLMSEGDRLDIWWNNAKVLERFVTADEVNQRVFFYLPAPAESGWVENCHYVLTRVGETEADPPSASLRIMIKLYKPGNFDREPHKDDGHSELNIVQLPPELVEQGVIDAGWAKDGVLATIPHYVYCTRDDKVRLSIGDHLLPVHRITQEQADNEQPIEILIEQADILRAGDGLQREIRYDINDKVWNWADRHSKRTYIEIDAGGWRLEAPIIKEAFNGVITIRDLNKLPVTVQIHARSQEFTLGDSVKMTFIGRPPNYAEPIICSETREIDNVPSVLEIKVPYDLIRAIVMGRADVSYILYKKDGGDPLSSKRAFATVVGDVNMLPEPNILELIGDTLEPDVFFATVEVRYAMKNGDLICLRWLGTKSNGDEYLHEVSHIVSANEATEGLVTFYIDAEHITVLDNGTLDLSYVVANDAPGLLDVRESERLLVKVGKIRATLPKPVVEEAEPSGDVLDPSKVFDSVQVLIGEAKTLDKDVVTYFWRSPNPISSTSDWLPITTVSAGKPVRFRVDKQYVTSNIAQYVDVRYVLWRAVSQRYEYSASLVLLIVEIVVPVINSVTDTSGEVIPDNGITFDTSVTVEGTASANLTLQLYDGAAAITPIVKVDASGNWTLPLTALSVSAHSITVKALYGSNPVSAARTFTVAVATAPTLMSVEDSLGEVAEGGTTFDNSVTLSGKAFANQKVEIFDGVTSQGQVAVDASGNWTLPLTALSASAHSITVKALYGHNPVSAARTFTVAVATAPTLMSVEDS
ncbi:Ig-like domain repeat protein, partial [Pseudomonas sp. SWRI81]|nr:Ig-like domain repeat protein [Pseudomonas sp. SWRI81]